MAITRNGLFTLDTSNPAFYTCCSRMHVKVALAFIISFLTFIELTEWYFYIFDDATGEKVDAGQAVLSIWQLISIIFMTISFFTEREHLLIPFILFMIFAVTMFGFWAMQLFVIVLFPFSDRATQLFGFKDDLEFGVREKVALTVLSVFTTLTTITGWFLHVGLACYVYFQSRNRAVKVQASAVQVRPPMVDPLAVKPPQESFPNMNFSISDDEEQENEDDREDKVFEKTSGPNMV